MIINKKDRLVWGIILIIVGLCVLFFVPFYTSLFFSVPLLIIGIVILLNKSEDKIEKRKDLNNTPSNKK